MAASGAKIASAYVQIVPSMQGIGKAITSAFNSAGNVAGAKAGQQAGDSLKNGFVSKTSGIASAVKAAFAAAAGSAVVAFGKQALDAYATYEQAIGGVQTLFKGAADTVAANAAKAYKTAGMSANSYMNTVTSFAAAMTSSVGGNVAKSAKLSDMAIRDMSDNANKMGTSMDSIVQTYQSLSRGNYAMLDNLKLGYGGTKSELQRLLDDASKLPAAMGKKFDISNFADVVTAIHLVQDNMGITGTTAREAATTIEGSVASMKASWENWLTGLGRSDVDMSSLSEQLVTSVATVGKNIAPRVVQIFKGVVAAIPQVFSGFGGVLKEGLGSAFNGVQLNFGSILTPQITNMVTEIMTKFMFLKSSLSNAWNNIKLIFVNGGIFDALAIDAQRVLQSVIGIFDSNTDTLLDLWASIVNSLSDTGFLVTIANVALSMGNGLVSAFQGVSAFVQPIVSSVGKFVATLVNAVATSQPFQSFLQKMGGLFQQVGTFIRSVLAPLGQWVSMIIDFVTQSGVMQVAVNAIGGVLSWLVGIVSGIMSAVQTVWSFIAPIITQALALILQVGNQIISNVQMVWAAILPIIQPGLNVIQAAFSLFSSVVSAVWNGFWSTLGGVVTAIWGGIQGIIQGAMTVIQGIIMIFTGLISGNWNQVWNGIGQVFTGIWATISSYVSMAINVVKTVISGGLATVSGVWSAAWNGIRNIFTTIWNGLTSTLRGLISGIGNILGGVKGVISNAFNGAGNWLTGVGRNIIDGLTNGIKGAFGTVQNAVSQLSNMIPDGVKKLLGIHSPSRVMRDMVGVYIPQGLAAGILKDTPVALNAMDRLGEQITKTGTFSTHIDYTSQFAAGKTTSQPLYTPRAYEQTSTTRDDAPSRLIDMLAYYLPIIVKGQETNLTRRDLQRMINGAATI